MVYLPIKLLQNISPDFVDERGEIFKLLDDGKTSIKSVLLITCKKGAIRANHYHKKDSHYSYMLSGSMEYFEMTVNGKNQKLESITVKKGDLVFTPPNTMHAMKFLEDSEFLALSTKSRKQADYEEDTVRVKLV